MKESFLLNLGGDELHAPVPASTPDATIPGREPLKHLLIGSPQVVKNGIHRLYALGYAEVGAWSPFLPTSKAGEVMSILVRYVVLV